VEIGFAIRPCAIKKSLKRGVSGVCETRRNVLELFGGSFQALGGQPFGFDVVVGGRASAFAVSLKQGLSFETFVCQKQGGHQKKPRIAHLTDRFHQFADFGVHIGRKLLEVIFLAVDAGDGVGPRNDHDDDQGHETSFLSAVTQVTRGPRPL
jgi:hypothetical protein